MFLQTLKTLKNGKQNSRTRRPKKEALNEYYDEILNVGHEEHIQNHDEEESIEEDKKQREKLTFYTCQIRKSLISALITLVSSIECDSFALTIAAL